MLRIPPSPPFFLSCFHLVDGLPLFVYLWRPLRLEERDWILSPSAPHIRLCLLLARVYPRCVMFLRNADAGVTQQNRGSFLRNAGQKQLHGEDVPEAVSVAARKIGLFEHLLHLGLAISP